MTTSNRPGGIPLPGRHLPQQPDPVDPADIRTEVVALLDDMAGVGSPIGQRARILEQAHDVLVRALGTVDKI